MLTIRHVSNADAGAIAEIYRPVVENTTISFEVVPPGADEMLRRIERIVAEYPWLVALDDGMVVGYAYASRHRERAAYASSVDTSVYVSGDARRRGVGTLLYRELFETLQRLGKFHRAFAGIALPNDASVALHKRHGFTFVGIYHEVGRKFDRWIDVSWWERSLSR